MTWIEDQVGGTVSFEGERPLGIAKGGPLGIGPGASFDELLRPVSGKATLELGMTRWQLGATMTGIVAETVTEPTKAVITLQQRGRTLEARPPFCNEQGHYFVTAPVVERHVVFHVPFGALEYEAEGPDAFVQVALTTGSTMVLSELFQLKLPPPPAWEPARLFEPMVRLCMGVAHADGKYLDDERRRIQTLFERELDLDAHGSADLRHVMDEGPPLDLGDTVNDLCVRFPGSRPGEILEFLAAVAFADGEVAPLEVRFLGDVADALGVPEGQWPRMAQDLGLDDH